VRSGENPRIEALSGLRFFAIAYLIVYHVGDATLERAPALLTRFTEGTPSLMPLFFV
jgi:peptidoglycan/LPS O-acetylase OafA/YrhL